MTKATVKEVLNAQGLDQDSTKANWTGPLVGLLTGLIHWLVTDTPPDAEEMGYYLEILLVSIATGVASWVTTYYKNNHVKAMNRRTGA